MKRLLQFFLIAVVCSLTLPQSAQAQKSGTWTLMNPSPVTLAGPAAAVLRNGKVLYANADGSGQAQIFDPSTNLWTATGNMVVKRNGPVVTARLSDGRVLVAGGWLYKISGGKRVATGDTSAELYDPTKGTFSATGSMLTGRAGGTTTTLLNGKILVTGGWASNALAPNPRYANSTNGADLYDPATGTWSPAAPMPMALVGHTATLLPGGRVLVTGGINYYVRTNSTASVYDPAINTWSATGSMTTSRSFHNAVLLPTGKVLVVSQSADLYDPVRGVFTASASASFMGYLMFQLPNGKALLQGYDWAAYEGVSALYDPLGATWTPTGKTSIPRYADVGVQLTNGGVLIVGGSGTDASSGRNASTSPEMYTP